MTPSPAEREVMARLLGMARESSLDAARRTLAALPAPPGMAVPGTDGDLLKRFVARIEKNGASTQRARNRGEVVAAVAAFIADRQTQRRFVAGHDARLAALPWRDRGLLPRFGVAGAGDRIAVSYARGGVAETGSLVLWTDRDNPALNNLLCDAQVVIVDRQDLSMRLEDLWSEPRLPDTKEMPRGIMLISGPSSTADIAMKLVLGAHGPEALHVIIVDPEAQSAAIAAGEDG